MGILGILKTSKLKLENRSNTESLPDVSVSYSIENFNLIEKYAAILMLKYYGTGCSLPDHYPLYFEKECRITNPRLLHRKLIEMGYLVPAPPEDILSQYKISELKVILESIGSNKSGTKDILIKRIISEADPDLLKNMYCNKNYYSTSEKGDNFLQQHLDYIEFHKFSSLGVDIEAYERKKIKLHSNNCKEILISIIQDQIARNPYESWIHARLSNLYDAANNPSKALYEHLICLYLRVNYQYTFKNITEDLKYIDKNKAIKAAYKNATLINVLTPDDASTFTKYLDVYSKDMLDEIYRKLPLTNMIISRHDFETILHEMELQTTFDCKKWNKWLLSKLAQYLRIK